MKKLVVFQLDEQQYGIDINRINSIERVMDITPVPKTQNYIKGIINLRGAVIPIIDLKERLDIGITEIEGQTRIMIVNLTTDFFIGLLVDAATDVIDVDASSIEKSPDIMDHSKQSVIKAIVKLEDNLLLLLDLQRILGDEDVEKLKEIVNE